MKSKKDIIKSLAINDKDVGSTAVQIGLLSEKINKLSEHFKNFKKDKHSARGLTKSVNQRRLMAIRAARLEAMRNLTEQVHGIRVNSRTTIIDAIVQNDSLRATVDGLIVGAKTVRINPVGSDTYEVVLELDQALINTIMKAARG